MIICILIQLSGTLGISRYVFTFQAVLILSQERFALHEWQYIPAVSINHDVLGGSHEIIDVAWMQLTGTPGLDVY